MPPASSHPPAPLTKRPRSSGDLGECLLPTRGCSTNICSSPRTQSLLVKKSLISAGKMMILDLGISKNAYPAPSSAGTASVVAAQSHQAAGCTEALPRFQVALETLRKTIWRQQVPRGLVSADLHGVVVMKP